MPSRTYQAQVLRGIHEPLVPEARPFLELRADEARIRLSHAALNHRDVWIQQGQYAGLKFPIVLGSDGCGVVEAVGNEVDPAWLGRTVVVNPGHGWGTNPAVQAKTFQILGLPNDGTCAEYVTVPAKYLHDKPDHLTTAQAAALPLAGLTGWRALFTRGQLTAGERVLITGIGGGVAQLMLPMAVATGAEVWVTSSSAEKLFRAVEQKARGGVVYTQPDWAKELATASSGFDLIVDSAGGKAFSQLIDLALPGGRIVFFGGTQGIITDLLPAKIFWKQLSLLGTTMGSDTEFADMLAFWARHRLVPVIDQVFPLAETQAAFDRLHAGQQYGKVILACG
jgi:NADPH:quinone reductase-like Zn-dependent oxidoreductase